MWYHALCLDNSYFISFNLDNYLQSLATTCFVLRLTLHLPCTWSAPAWLLHYTYSLDLYSTTQHSVILKKKKTFPSRDQIEINFNVYRWKMWNYYVDLVFYLWKFSGNIEAWEWNLRMGQRPIGIHT